MDPVPKPNFRELLEPQEDERVVLSVCAQRLEGDQWRLTQGTLLVVPTPCATSCWAQQRSAGRGARAAALPAEMVVEGEQWLLARQLIPVSEAEHWLEEAFEKIETGEELAMPGSLDNIAAPLDAPDFWRRVMPQIDTPTSSLIAGLARPVEGIYLPASEPGVFTEPDRIEYEGMWSFRPTVEVAGIHITPKTVAPEIATAPGLLVARAERRAWLGDSRGQRDFERFNVEIRFDRELVDIDQLELTHNEFRGGDIVLSSRFRLRGDRDGGDFALASIPTIGRSVHHELLLHTDDGELLDRSGPYPLAERIEIKVSMNGEETPPIISGVSGPPPALIERVARSRQVQVELSEERRRTAALGIIRDRREGLARVAEQVGRARDELLVMDPFFGQHAEEWGLLGDVEVPVRVVTAKIEMGEDGQPAPVDIPDNVEARYRPKAPMHDRVYVWRGGGFWLGGSLSSLGHVPIGTGELGADEAQLWSEIFEALWTSGLLRAVPLFPT